MSAHLSPAPPGDDTPPDAPMSGQTKRRLRTRAALLKAGRTLLVEGRVQVSIEEITKTAGIGFGTFYNHFTSKEELFAEAVFDVLDTYTSWLRASTAELEDPAEIFAASFRITGRLASENPELLAPLLARGTEVLLVDRGLRTAALEDLERGVAQGRFIQLDPDVLLMVVGGALLGMVRVVVDEPARVPTDVVDDLARGVLRLLGVTDDEAARIVAGPVPTPPGMDAWAPA